jgi:Ca2+-binding EF-hand superfamily protein
VRALNLTGWYSLFFAFSVDADGDGNITYDEFVGAMMLSTDEDMMSV